MSLRPALIFILCCVAGAAQTTAPDTPHFSVKGHVVNSVTGEPVRGALVQLNGQDQHSGFSGGDGAFQIDNVAKGNVYVTARHPGYSGLVGNRPQMINVTDNMDGLTVKMPPAAKISGTVRDSDGEPVEGLSIMATREAIMAGRKNLQQSGSAITDEGGHFVMDNLLPGTYILGTSQKTIYPGLPPSNDASRLMYAAQYYPNAPDAASAEKIDVKPGDDSHIDFRVSDVRGVRVSFTVNPPSTAFVWGTLEGADGRVVRTPFQKNNKTGKFVIASVPAGSWTLVVNAGQADRNQPNRGEAQINVGNADLDNIQIDVGNTPEIPVVITGGDAPLVQPPPPPSDATGKRGSPGSIGPGSILMANQPVRISLRPTSPSPLALTGGRSIYSMEGLVIRNVPPGTYRAVAQTWGTNCVDSITSGSLDLARNDLVISSGSPAQPINVTLMANCPHLDISLNQKRDATIIVVGESHANEPWVAGVSAAASTITVGNLSPGEYTVYAFTDADGLEYSNPEAMRSFGGQHVTLTAGQKSTVALDVIDREAK